MRLSKVEAKNILLCSVRGRQSLASEAHHAVSLVELVQYCPMARFLFLLLSVQQTDLAGLDFISYSNESIRSRVKSLP